MTLSTIKFPALSALLCLLLVIPQLQLQAAEEGAPAEPEELRAEIYSPTALELFWARWVIEDVAGYEVARDGVVLDPLRNGLSFFDSELMPGQTYRYALTTINSLGIRSPTVFTTVKMPLDAASVTPAPKTPTGFSSAEYSDTLLELFWDRPAVSGLIYEISRDGEIIATTDGVSLLDSDYQADATGFYTLVAIAPDGLRSAAAKLMLGSALIVPAPSNVMAFRYSATAAELVWDRAEEGSVMKTEIERDGELLQIVRGNSYFDGERSPGQDTTYILTAVNFNGQRSAPSVITVAPY